MIENESMNFSARADRVRDRRPAFREFRSSTKARSKTKASLCRPPRCAAGGAAGSAILLLGRGEEKTGAAQAGADRRRYEALIAAIYLDAARAGERLHRPRVSAQLDEVRRRGRRKDYNRR